MRRMILECMLSIYPSYVFYVALSSRQAEDPWNLLPTVQLTIFAVRVASRGFEEVVNATANLSLHFRQRFSDDRIRSDDYFPSSSNHSAISNAKEVDKAQIHLCILWS